MLSHVRRKRLNRFYSTPGIKSRFNHLLRRCSTTIKVSLLITFELGCTNPGRQVARTIRFCMAPSDICESSIWNWPTVLLESGIFKVAPTLVENLCTPATKLSHKTTYDPEFRGEQIPSIALGPISRVVLHQAHSSRLAKQCRSVIRPTDTLVNQRLSVCHHIHAGGGGDMAPTRTRVHSPSLTSPLTREKCGVVKIKQAKNKNIC